MAVGLPETPELAPVPGVRIGTAELGGRAVARHDLVVFALAPDCECAAVFTRNAFCAAPVTVSRRHLHSATPRYLLVNAGNANAGTGERGIEDAVACCQALSSTAGCRAQEVLPFSTGVIGEPLQLARFAPAIEAAYSSVVEDGWLAAARAIMTTDTVPKGVSIRFEHGGRPCMLTGVVKGAGMIRPDMATMLAFMATDAALAPGLAQRLLSEAVEASFNRITIDGDTSTNDACVLVATGASGAPPIAGDDAEAVDAFATVLQGIVRDAEGATKFVTVVVEGGASERECRQVADAVAHSPLVKTALFASDPNWGRIVAAVGRAGIADLDVAAVDIYLGDVCIVRGGARCETYTEEQGQRVMAEEEIAVRIALGRGGHALEMWTCDLSHGYVTINAEYRT
jgi:glutamate N-acetyltransferase/amino-acid N-acetyltransferase